MAKKWSIALDHAALAVLDISKLKRVFQILGLTDSGTEDVPSQKVRTHFLNPDQNLTAPAMEILEPTDSESPVAKFLQKKGAGIHHLSFAVSDIDAVMAELKTNGVRLIYTTAQPGAHHTLVNFIHPESTGGILLEISQKRA